MKIAIVAPFFHPNRGYQENNWLDITLELNHDTHIFCSSFSSSGLNIDTSKDGKYDDRVHRLPSKSYPLGIIHCDESLLMRKLLSFSPDLILHIGHNTYFGRSVFSYKKMKGNDVKVASFNGEISTVHKYHRVNKNITALEFIKTYAWILIRGPVNLRAIHSYDLPICTTKDCYRILTTLLLRGVFKRYRNKLRVLPLCYNKVLNYYDKNERDKTRRELELKNRKVILCSSRIEKTKIDRFLRDMAIDISNALRERDDFIFIFVGFVPGNPVSDSFEQELRTYFRDDQLILETLANQQRLNALYNAADIIVFPAASNSAQQALGTGAYVLLTDIGVFDHLMSSDKQGLFYDVEPGDQISAKLDQCLEHLQREERTERVSLNQSIECRTTFKILLDMIHEQTGDRLPYSA